MSRICVISDAALAEYHRLRRGVAKNKLKRRLLGYGLFSGVYWGSCVRFWQFESKVGIQQSRAAVDECSSRVLHCLSQDVRRIYNTTLLNFGHHTSPHWKRATRKMIYDHR